jgi:hypothetical protein
MVIRRFTLKTLLLAISVACVGLALLGREPVELWRRHAGERAIEAAVARSGGTVELVAFPGSRLTSFLTAGKYDACVFRVSAEGSRAKAIPEIIKQSSKGARLNSISITDASVSADDLEPLVEQPTLRKVYLDKTDADDECLEVLSQCPKLSFVSLRKTPVTDVGVRQLLSSSRIESLTLDDTFITDKSLEKCGDHPTLRVLSALRCNVSDQGLAFLGKSQSLEELHVSGYQLTDVGLLALSEMPTLKVVDVIGSSITRAGINDFRAQSDAMLIVGSLPK